MRRWWSKSLSKTEQFMRAPCELRRSVSLSLDDKREWAVKVDYNCHDFSPLAFCRAQCIALWSRGRSAQGADIIFSFWTKTRDGRLSSEHTVDKEKSKKETLVMSQQRFRSLNSQLRVAPVWEDPISHPANMNTRLVTIMEVSVSSIFLLFVHCLVSSATASAIRLQQCFAKRNAVFWRFHAGLGQTRRHRRAGGSRDTVRTNLALCRSIHSFLSPLSTTPVRTICSLQLREGASDCFLHRRSCLHPQST